MANETQIVLRTDAKPGTGVTPTLSACKLHGSGGNYTHRRMA